MATTLGRVRRPALSVPYALAVLTVLVMAAEVAVSLQNQEGLTASSGLLIPFVCAVPVTFSLMGALIATRDPGNRIGWIMIAVGLGFALSVFTSDYPGVTAEGHRITRPFGLYVAWVSTWVGWLPLVSLFLLVLLFPTGRISGKRWGPVLWLGLTAWMLLNVLSAIQSGPLDPGTVLTPNPLGLVPVPGMVIGIVTLAGLAAMVLAVVSLILRFRSARGDVRQQLKWFTYGAAITIACNIGGFLTLWSNALVVALWLASAAALPIFIGIAIMRYRLYEIDALINRTLVYGSLTISLGLVYVGGVLVLQSATRATIGHSSDLAIAVVTLAVAGLFNPWRRRLQTFIDRRFYRHKYDAVLTLAALSGRLRDNVDLPAVRSEILTVVDETMQPSHTSLWLR
jgi:hypothetical protein